MLVLRGLLHILDLGLEFRFRISQCIDLITTETELDVGSLDLLLAFGIEFFRGNAITLFHFFKLIGQLDVVPGMLVIPLSDELLFSY